MVWHFAKKNTTLQFGVVRSWDKVFPQTRSWKRDKNVLSFNGGFTQILSKNALIQLDGTYSKMDGFLSDAYQVVNIIYPNEDRVVNLEPIHPGERIRRAIGSRIKFRVGANASLEGGYRYYWDTWEVTSHTMHTLFQKYMAGGKMTLSLGFRYYLQSRAFFFKEAYSQPEALMAVDSKLDSGNSQEYQFKLRFNGDMVPLFGSEKMDVNFKLNYYHRFTDRVDWHSRLHHLSAIITSIGFRYRF